MKNSGKRKIIISIVLVLFLASIAILSYRLTTYTIDFIKEQTELKKEKEEKERIERERTNFNRQFHSPVGFSAYFLNQTIDTLIDSNKVNPSRLVELIYNGESCGIDASKIQKVKEKLDNFKDYDVSFNYDSDGYIYQMVVVEQRETPDDFNRKFEFRAGSTIGHSLEIYLTELITHNKSNPDYPIELVFDQVSYGADVNKIQNKKEHLGGWTKYEVSFEYDSEGYIIQFVVVTK